MMFDFYTAQAKYTVGEKVLLKDGEVIAEGDVFLFQVLLGCPAVIIISEDVYQSPLIINTSRVESILPEYEFFDGEQRPQKLMYKVNYSEKDKKTPYLVVAVDPIHATSLLQNLFISTEIESIKTLEGNVRFTEEGYKVC